MLTQNELVELVNSFDNSDYENVQLLEKAVNMYRRTWETIRAYKNALIAEINDQYENHDGELGGEDHIALYNLLN